jgi:hypothetical protein
MIEALKPTHPESGRSEYANFNSIAAAVDHVKGGFPEKNDRSAEQTLVLAESVQDLITQSLRFDKEAELSDITENQATTCVGYTIAGSEALESAEVDHYVAFMNGHANLFIPLESDNETKVWMLDMLCQDLSQDVSDNFMLYKHDEDAERSYGTLRTNAFNSEKFRNEEIHKQYPWVALKDYEDYRLEPGSNRRLIVTLAEPALGREDVKKYAEFREAFDKNDLESASQALLDISGRFPDIDIRSCSVKRVNSLVKKLAYSGHIDEAREVTVAFYDSFVGSDSRVLEKRADCIKEIAKASGRPEFAKKAVSLYEKSLAKRQTDRECVIGKIATSKDLILTLEP